MAGGTYNNTAADTRVLNKLGLNIKPRSAAETFFSFESAADDVCKEFSKFGIGVNQRWGTLANTYFKDGKQISREDAFRHVANALGKPMPDISY